jgi:hypothetical protein
MNWFPRPAPRTVRAGFPHTALQLGFTPRHARSSYPLGPEVQLLPEVPKASWSSQAQRQSPPSLLPPKHPNLRPLPSTGITRLHRYYEPLRHPPRPAPSERLSGTGPSPRWASRVPTRSVSTCHPHYPGESPGALAVVPAPGTAAFPALSSGRHSQRLFRGLLRVHCALRPADLLAPLSGAVVRAARRPPVTQRPPARGYEAEPPNCLGRTSTCKNTPTFTAHHNVSAVHDAPEHGEAGRSGVHRAPALPIPHPSRPGGKGRVSGPLH